MRESFVEGLLRKSAPQDKVAARLRLNVLRWCTSEVCKYSITSAIVMATAMTFCSSAILGVERFTSALHERFMSKWWHRSKVEAWNFTNKTLKPVNSMKADFLFFGLNLNTIVQEKTPETCTFHGCCFKNKEH